MESKDDDSGGSSFPLLKSLGFSSDGENFHDQWLKKIVGSDLDYKFLTNAIMLELWNLVEIGSAGSGSCQVVSPGKMSRRQFAQLISCLLYRNSSVTTDFIKNVACKRDLVKLSKIVESGKVQPSDVWKMGSKLASKVSKDDIQPSVDNEKNESVKPNSAPKYTFPAEMCTDEHVSDELVDESFNDEMDNSEEKVNKDKNNPALVEAGLLDEADQSIKILLNRMRSWEPNQDDITNGLVLEVSEHFSGTGAVQHLSLKIIKLLNFHPSKQKKTSLRRVCQLFKYTSSKMSRQSQQLGNKWSYFKDLSPGGKLFRQDLLQPSSMFEEMIERIQSTIDQENLKTCNNCLKRGDFFCCQGCFSSFYCSRSCQNNDWIKNHKDDCKDVAANLLQEAALRPPDKDELDC